jgi:hypothetical protein
VLPIEQLRADKAGYLDRLSAFTGVPIPRDAALPARNVGRGALVMDMERRLNHVLRADRAKHADYRTVPLSIRMKNRALRTAQRTIPASMHGRMEARHRTVIRDCVGDYFRSSNARTAALCALDLRALGYDIAAPASHERPEPARSPDGTAGGPAAGGRQTAEAAQS